MGLSSGEIEALSRLRREGLIHLPAAVIEVGAQQLSNDFLRAQVGLDALRELFGVTKGLYLPPPQPAALTEEGIEHLSETAPLARHFWEWLGFEYASVDIDGSPQSIPLDLNYDDVPNWARRKFQVVTNFGTTEHVANQLNAFKIIHDLTAPGGIMMHNLPSQGMVNHGLINYNPKFFWMLARSNDYRLLDFNYSGTDQGEDLPPNVVNQIMQFRAEISERKEHYKVCHGSLFVILQKVCDIEFVAPLDVPTGTKATNKILGERYWTVFR